MCYAGYTLDKFSIPEISPIFYHQNRDFAVNSLADTVKDEQDFVDDLKLNKLFLYLGKPPHLHIRSHGFPYDNFMNIWYYVK